MSMTLNEAAKFTELAMASGMKAVPLWVGHTGCGKTERIKQIAMSKNMDIITIHVAHVEPSDFSGLFKISDDNRTMTCPPSWLPYKEYKVSKGVTIDSPFPADQGFINPNGGIIFLDEVNRGREDMRQAIHQLLAEKRIHVYQLPTNYFLVAAANPESYEVYEFDPALKNKFARINIEPVPEETLSYLLGKYGNNHILSWLKTDVSLIDFEAKDSEDYLLTPRTVENAIVLYESLKKESKMFIRKALETLIQPEKVQSFLTYREELMYVNFEDILAGKKSEKIQELLKKKKMDILSTLSSDLAYYVSHNEFSDKEAKNVVDYLALIPPDINMAFINSLDKGYFANPKCIIRTKYFKEKLGKDKLAQYTKYADV